MIFNAVINNLPSKRESLKKKITGKKQWVVRERKEMCQASCYEDFVM